MASILGAPTRSFHQNLFSLSHFPTLNCRAVNVNVIPSIDAVKFCSKSNPIPIFRSKNTKVLQLRQRSFSVSPSDSSDTNSIQEVKDGSEATDGGRDPPFLTILAGLLLFFLITWIFGSIVMSLLGLVVKLIPSK